MTETTVELTHEDHIIVRIFLFPGNWVVRKFNVQEESSKMLLRMYINLAIYAKIAGTIAFLLY